MEKMGSCCQKETNVTEILPEPTAMSAPPVAEPNDQFHTKDLLSNNFTELTKFTFNGIITKARVIDVYDGDTVTIVFYFHDIPIKDSFRLFGYDSPEMKPPKTLINRDLHIRAATIVRDYLKIY